MALCESGRSTEFAQLLEDTCNPPNQFHLQTFATLRRNRLDKKVSHLLAPFARDSSRAVHLEMADGQSSQNTHAHFINLDSLPFPRFTHAAVSAWGSPKASKINIRAWRATELTRLEAFSRKIFALAQSTNPQARFFINFPRTSNCIEPVLDCTFAADLFETPYSSHGNLVRLFLAFFPNGVVATLVLQQRNLNTRNV